MRPQTLARWLLGATFAAGAFSPAAALAQEPLSLDRFDPAPAGDRLFGVPSPYVAGDLTPHAMLLVDYAHNPFVLRQSRDSETIGAVVDNQLFMHVNASLALWQRLNLNINIPVALFQSGESPVPGDGATFPSPSSTQFGDIRLNLRLRMTGEAWDPFQVAFAGSVWLPTGANEPGSYVTDAEVRGLPQLIMGGRFGDERWFWSAQAGVEVRKSQTIAKVAQGSQVQGGAGIGVQLGDERRAQIGLEATFAVVAVGGEDRNTNAEALFSGKYRFGSAIEAGAGVGLGLARGIGTPDVRAVAMVAYTPEYKKPAPPPPDTDKDGILDANDACPAVAGPASADPKKNGCPPPPDSDGDGILDSDDACPTVAGLANADPTKNGCPPPPDADGDGILDSDDACPAVAGIANADPKKNGCPPDRDNDGVPDAADACPDHPGFKTADPATNGCPGDTDKDTIRDDKDACPREKGKPNVDPLKHGCPTAVRVSESEIIILQQVQFDTAKATIKKESSDLLDEVAEVLKEHPELTKLEVQGHTDTKGNAKINQTLSQNRAAAVMTALIKRGVEAARLTAKGYGQTIPIASNDNDEGRQKNRRVQFKILEKTAAQK